MTMKVKVRMMRLLALKIKEKGHKPGYVGSLEKVGKARKWIPESSRKK